MSVKKILALTVFVALILVLFWYINERRTITAPVSTDSFTTSVTIGNVPLLVSVADSAEKRVQGLSGSEGLSMNKGMLFIFEYPGIFSFWMKDMKYPIDIIWISEEKKVVHIEKAVTPDTFPKTFSSKENALYVLEVSSGFSDTHTITVGSVFEFN